MPCSVLYGKRLVIPFFPCFCTANCGITLVSDKHVLLHAAVRALLAGGTHGVALETAARRRKRPAAAAAAAGVGSSSGATSNKRVKPEPGTGPVVQVDLTGKVSPWVNEQKDRS